VHKCGSSTACVQHPAVAAAAAVSAALAAHRCSSSTAPSSCSSCSSTCCYQRQLEEGRRASVAVRASVHIDTWRPVRQLRIADSHAISIGMPRAGQLPKVKLREIQGLRRGRKAGSTMTVP
jgi:hypothetical protein